MFEILTWLQYVAVYCSKLNECLLLFQPFATPVSNWHVSLARDSGRHMRMCTDRERERETERHVKHWNTEREKWMEGKTYFAMMLYMLAYVGMLLLICICKSFNQCWYCKSLAVIIATPAKIEKSRFQPKSNQYHNSGKLHSILLFDISLSLSIWLVSLKSHPQCTVATESVIGEQPFVGFRGSSCVLHHMWLGCQRCVPTSYVEQSLSAGRGCPCLLWLFSRWETWWILHHGYRWPMLVILWARYGWYGLSWSFVGSMFFICLNASSRAERTQSHYWMCMNVRHDGQQRRSNKEPTKYMRLSMQTI